MTDSDILKHVGALLNSVSTASGFLTVNFLKKNEITIPNLQSRKAKEPTYELNGCETL